METTGTIFYPLKDDRSSDRKRANAGTIACPYCGRSVPLVPFGSGWVGTCCDRVVYNSHQLPPEH